MQEKKTIYNGVTMGEFISATRVVSSFISGVASAPTNPNLDADLMMAGLLVIPILEAHNTYIARIRSLKDTLEAQLEEAPIGATAD